jgi:hypothetical protein
VGDGGGEVEERGGGLRSSSQDSCFSHILGNDAEQGLVLHCLQGCTLWGN